MSHLCEESRQMQELRERRGHAPSARSLLVQDKEWVICRNPAHPKVIRHPLRAGREAEDYLDFCANHKHQLGCVPQRIGPEAMERAVRKAEHRRGRLHLSRGFLDNADVKEAFGTEQGLDTTGLSALAVSVTAGWCSGYLDNSTGLFLDFVGYSFFSAVNTAASSQKAHYLYGPGTPTIANGYFTITSGAATIGATYTNNGQTFTVLATIAAKTILHVSGTGAPAASGTLTKASGTGDSTITFSAYQIHVPVNSAGNFAPSSATGATMTYLDITTSPSGFPLIKTVPYITTNKIITSNGLFGWAKGHDGVCPKYCWLGLVNAAGPTIDTPPGVIRYMGSYNTVI